jgi:DNA-binding LytR/AlgR family response regulator
MKKKVLIVDDDQMVSAMLTKLISLYPMLELAGTCETCADAKAFFEKEVVDIVLLDIELSDGQGFDLIPFISGEPSIIVITGNEDYAFTAFEIGAIDFLKKPILPNRFKVSIDKILERTGANAKPAIPMDKEKPFLFIKSGVKIIKIEIDRLIYAEALRDYVKLVLTNNENHLVNLSLSELSKRLASYGFMQVHRSYAISIRHIKTVQDDQIFLQEGGNTPIPIGKTYKSVISELLK